MSERGRRYGKLVWMLAIGLFASGCKAERAPEEGASNQQHIAARTERNSSDSRPLSLSLPPLTASTQRLAPPASTVAQPDVKVKGVYATAWAAVGSRFDRLLELIEQTDLNAMVIDVKTDSGQVTFPADTAMVKDTGAASHAMIADLAGKVEELHRRNIYAIARLVVFKDPYLAERKPEWAMRTKDGNVWRDPKGTAWVDPFREEVWRYNQEIAVAAASAGFDEIQFDYIRFPENGKRVDEEVTFPASNGRSKADAVQQFLHESRAKLAPYRVKVSADVFGMTASSDNDMGIGQIWSRMAPELDIICPMVYPSHYADGAFGIEHPDLQPYRVIQRALGDALAKNDALRKQSPPAEPAAIRPWLQSFTAAWLKPHLTYGNVEVQEQIKAARELGIDEFLIWNSGSKYSYR